MNANTTRVFCYSTDDERIFVYNFSEKELQETAEIFTRDIWFMMTDEEFNDSLVSLPPEIVDNLKSDFIWFRPNAQGRSIIQCTCNQFLESGHNTDKLAVLGFKHHQRTGHRINLRGN